MSDNGLAPLNGREEPTPDRLSRAVRAWERFWFAPVETSTLAIVRIALGVVMIAFTLSIGTDLTDYFSRRGTLPSAPYEGGPLGLLDLLHGDLAVFLVWALLLVGSGCLLVGFHTRLASLVVFVTMLSFQRRNPFIFNSGDGLARLLCLYVMLAPAGASLSVDRWRRAKDRFWEFPSRAPWALRLIQVQVSVIYIATVVAKLGGPKWTDGTAVAYALRIDGLIRFPVPSFIHDNVILINLMTYATLAIELSIGFLVWNRRARPWVLGLGVVLHLTIDLTITVVVFSWAIFVTYLSFVPEDTASRWLLRLRARLGQSRSGALRKVAQLERKDDTARAPSEYTPDAAPGRAPVEQPAAVKQPDPALQPSGQG